LLAGLVRRGGGWLVVLLVLSIVDSAAAVLLPAVLGRAVDAAVAGHGYPFWIGVAVLLVAAAMAAETLTALAAGSSTAAATRWLRHRLVARIAGWPPETTDRFGAGDLVSRVTGQAYDAGRAGPALVDVALAGVVPAGAVLALALIDPWLALAFCAGAVLVLGLLRAFGRRVLDLTGRYQRVQSTIAGSLAEALAGSRTIAAAGTAAAERTRILRPLPELRAHGMATWRAVARAAAQAAVVVPVVQIAVLVTGGVALAAGRISAGELFAASRYAVLGTGFGMAVSALNQWARARAGTRRAEQVLACEPLRHGTRSLPDGPGCLELCRVTVAGGPDRPLLDGVDLLVPGGGAVAVVGRSGAGKSVLAAVAGRLRDPDGGVVLLDGVPLPELSHAALRSAVGTAFAVPALVGRTVAEAVGAGRDEAAVRAAARAAAADDFISRLPAGYQTPLADAPMSGGERQRLGLARAWPATRLLVLDDATSSLDTATELRITRSLEDRARRRTRLIVTHRLATAARADSVVWLEDGRVRAAGPHAALWRDPAYRAVFT
jgi:ATP-binding cassette subfamily B protein